MQLRRNLSTADRAITAAGRLLHTLAAPAHAARPFPSRAADADLRDAERTRSRRYMRVNHVGEVCAQSLYAAQGLTARDPETAAQMRRAAAEETDHLAWCEQRLEELGGRPSLLNPLWGLGALVIGGVAGLAGPRWNLGFVAETERQVARHLESHIGKLPAADTRSRELLTQMQADEVRHMEEAHAAGGAELPRPVRGLMKISAKTMTSLSYWI